MSETPQGSLIMVQKSSLCLLKDILYWIWADAPSVCGYDEINRSIYKYTLCLCKLTFSVVMMMIKQWCILMHHSFTVLQCVPLRCILMRGLKKSKASLWLLLWLLLLLLPVIGRSQKVRLLNIGNPHWLSWILQRRLLKHKHNWKLVSPTSCHSLFYNKITK